MAYLKRKLGDWYREAPQPLRKEPAADDGEEPTASAAAAAAGEDEEEQGDSSDAMYSITL